MIIAALMSFLERQIKLCLSVPLFLFLCTVLSDGINAAYYYWLYSVLHRKQSSQMAKDVEP